MNQFTNNNFVEAANKIMRTNYEFANELYTSQVQFAQNAAKTGAENLQRFRDAKNPMDILNAQSDCLMSSMQTAVDNFQSNIESTVEMMNRSNKAYSEIVDTDVSNEKTKQKSTVTRKKKTTKRA